MSSRMRGGWALVRRFPATVGFLAIVSATTGALAAGDDSSRLRMLQASSTNLEHLSHDPVRVLVASPFWLSPGAYLVWAPLAGAILACAEYLVGTRRLCVVFAAGHVGATLLAALGEWEGIRIGAVAAGVAKSLDVGISYGLYAVVAYVAVLAPRRWRPLSVGAPLAYFAYGAFDARTFTAFGHVFAVVIGAGLAAARQGRGPAHLRAALVLAASAILVVAAAAGGLVERPYSAPPVSAPPRTGLLVQRLASVRAHHRRHDGRGHGKNRTERVARATNVRSG